MHKQHKTKMQNNQSENIHHHDFQTRIKLNEEPIFKIETISSLMHGASDTSMYENSILPTMKKQKTCRQTLTEISDSQKFHIFIISLVVLDCLFVAGELIIDYVEIQMFKSERTSQSTNEAFLLSKEIDLDRLFNNATQHHSAFAFPGSPEPSVTLVRALKFFEKVFKYGSFCILSVFVIEITFKMVISPKKFLGILNIFDSVVVFTGFFLNLYLLNGAVVIHSLASIITVLR